MVTPCNHIETATERNEALARIRAQAVALHQQTPPDALLTTTEVALMTGLSVPTLATWRSRRVSRLPFLKVGRRVKYSLGDVLAFLDAARVPACTDADRRRPAA